MFQTSIFQIEDAPANQMYKEIGGRSPFEVNEDIISDFCGLF
jgi:hypothetical protein